MFAGRCQSPERAGASDANHSRVAAAGSAGRSGRDAWSPAGGQLLVVVQSCAGRPPVGIWVLVTRPAMCRAFRAVSI